MNTETQVQETNNNDFQSNDSSVSTTEFDLSNMILDRYKKRTNMNDFEFKQLKDMLVAVNSNDPIITIEEQFFSLIQKGFNQKRSGDVVIALNSGWIEWNSPTGTTHGSCFSYDTHVPLLFWGKGIQQGVSDEYISICDIAPTVSTLLGISFPNGCTGQPIRSITE